MKAIPLVLYTITRPYKLVNSLVVFKLFFRNEPISVSFSPYDIFDEEPYTPIYSNAFLL